MLKGHRVTEDRSVSAFRYLLVSAHVIRNGPVAHVYGSFSTETSKDPPALCTRLRAACKCLGGVGASPAALGMAP